MIIKVEVGIDLDDKRRIWIEGSAQTAPGESVAVLAPAVIKELTAQVTGQAMAIHEKAAAQMVISGALAGGDGRAPSERPKRPDDPPTMRAMQEEDPDAQ